MPTILPLSPVPENELRRIVGLPAARQIKTSFPKRALATASEPRSAVGRMPNRFQLLRRTPTSQSPLSSQRPPSYRSSARS